MTDIVRKPQIQVFIEEDILVPDTKPDMKDIVLMDGKVRVSDKGTDAGSLRVVGDLVLDILYTPEALANGVDYPLVPMETRISFKNDTESLSHTKELDMCPTVENIDYTIVNERKFKVKALITFNVKEYNDVEQQLFEGVKNEEVQLLKKKIRYTDLAERKCETAEIREDIHLREDMPDIAKILRTNVNIIENHRQIARDKAVINATASYNILYISAEEEPRPMYYQGKCEFTQFIKLADTENVPGTRVNFQVAKLHVSPKGHEEESCRSMELCINVDTSIELFKNHEREIITDVYHHLKDVNFDSNDVKFMYLQGVGNTDINLRETVTVASAESIAYMEGRVYETGSSLDHGKNIFEGVLVASIVGIENGDVFKVKQEIPFRSYIELPGITKEMMAENEFCIKEINFEKLNNKQVEIHAVICAKTMVTKNETHTLIRSVDLVDPDKSLSDEASIVLYIAKKGDTIWKIAKKYRSTIDEICKINQLEQENELKSGEKILIVRRMQ